MNSVKTTFQMALLAVAVIMTFCTSDVRARPSGQEAGSAQQSQPQGEMNQALNYLAELDKYYSNVARPR